MRGRELAVACLALVVLTSAVGCSSNDGPGGGDADLDEGITSAAAVIPADSFQAFFTDWRAVADAFDTELAPEITGNAPLFKAMTDRGAPPFAAYTGYAYPDHETQVGWSFNEVEWEASFQRPEGPLAYVFHFEDGFDPETMLSLFETREYETSERDGITIYSHDADAEWLSGEAGPAAPTEILNVAMVDDTTIAISSEVSEVQAAASALTQGDSGASETILAPAGHFEDSPMSMFFSGDEENCNTWSNPPAAGPEGAEEVLEFRGQPYVALGMGYTFPEGGVAATAVLTYSEEEQAAEDLEIKEAAAQGNAAVTGEPYSDSLFQLESVSVDGRDIVLELGAVDGVLNLTSPIQNADLLFALC